MPRGSRRSLVIRSSMSGHPDPFRTVRDLGFVLARCSCQSGIARSRSPRWLPAWLPASDGPPTWPACRESARACHAGRLPARLWSLSAAPPPHRTDCCRSIRRRGESRADWRVRSPGTFTCARCPAGTSALDAVPEAYHNPAAVWWGAFAASAGIWDQVVIVRPPADLLGPPSDHGAGGRRWRWGARGTLAVHRVGSRVVKNGAASP
jgi:hypothetical protein